MGGKETEPLLTFTRHIAFQDKGPGKGHSNPDPSAAEQRTRLTEQWPTGRTIDKQIRDWKGAKVSVKLTF